MKKSFVFSFSLVSHIIYTTNSRTTIMHAVFDEYAIIGSPPEP